jgi:hypothetical protein
MADKHCFTHVNIAPPAPPAPNAAAGPYIVKKSLDNAPVADIYKYTFVEYSFDPALDTAAQTNIADATAADMAATARRINFFKFAPDGTNPKYIKTHDALYDDTALPIAPISPNNKKYLIMSKDGEMLGGSKSSRKGRKSARKGRKSARKSRRARGSRSKK